MLECKEEQISKTVSVDIVYPADRFWVRDTNGDDAQIRLEPNGKIYLCYTASNRRVIESCELTWAEFLIRFRPLIDLIISEQ
jgi:hypothetical protein